MLKKFTIGITALSSILTLSACSNGDSIDDNLSFELYDPSQELDIPNGYNSLINKNQNPKIVDGYYNIAGNKIKVKDTYKTTYSTEPTDAKLNYLINNWTYNSDLYSNMVDGLVENDKYSNITGALAYAYDVDTINGKEVWTFKLRKGVPWIDNKTGKIVAEVTSDDFVCGLEYVLNPINASTTSGVVIEAIDGAREYYNSLENKDKDPLPFSTVGVEAIDKYTIRYTLNNPTPYFLTNLTYSPFLPVNREYLDQMGTDFGSTKDNILVNGPFRMTSHEAQTKIVFTKNDNYWDKEHVYVDKVIKKYYDSNLPITTPRIWYESDEIDSFTVNNQDNEGYIKYVLGQDNTGSLKKPYDSSCSPVLNVGDATYVGYFNFARTTYEYSNPSDNKTERQKYATSKALLSTNFRKGFLYGLDVMSYLKRYNENEPQEWLARSFTNRELCQYNGKDYADYVDDVYNEKNNTNISLSGFKNGYDPIFDVNKAKVYFNKAKNELIDSGALVESDFPIQIDIIGNQNAVYQQFDYQMLASISEAGDGIVKICYNIPSSDDQETKWTSVSNNYDLSMWSGWGPDYADPKTFAECFSLGGAMVSNLGFNQSSKENIELENLVLGEYDKLYKKAESITNMDKLDERYKAFALAEYSLIYDYAIIIPWLTKTGYTPTVSKVIPYQVNKAAYGLSGAKLKNVVVAEVTISREIRDLIEQDYYLNLTI